MYENATVVINNGNRTIKGRVTSIEFGPIGIGEVPHGTVDFQVMDIEDKEQVTKQPEKEEYNWRYE